MPSSQLKKGGLLPNRCEKSENQESTMASLFVFQQTASRTLKKLLVLAVFFELHRSRWHKTVTLRRRSIFLKVSVAWAIPNNGRAPRV